MNLHGYKKCHSFLSLNSGGLELHKIAQVRNDAITQIACWQIYKKIEKENKKWKKLMTFQKQQKHRKNIARKKVIRILHRIAENVSVADRISILKKDEQETEKSGMEFLLREHQRN